VVVVLAGCPEAEAPRWSWPVCWAERLPLLESQHDRLEALIQELLQLHRCAVHPWSLDEALAVEAACCRLLWDLRLHLRLEERWLSQSHCLCPGHRAAHAEALDRAAYGLTRSAADRRERLCWLEDLQAWFVGHRLGPDATAYANATACSR
jgi:hypothetical protein